MKENKRLLKGNAGIIVVVVLVIILIGGYFLYTNRHAVKSMLMPSSQSQTSGSNNSQTSYGNMGASPSVTISPSSTTNTQIDTQMNSIQGNLNSLDQDQTSITSINQNADNATQ